MSIDQSRGEHYYLVSEVDFELLGECLGDHGVPGDGGADHSEGGHQPAQTQTSETRSLQTWISVINIVLH